MKTDSLFYRLFQELPGCYFEAIGADAKTAEGYRFTSEEIKQAGLRLDGVFVPVRTAAPVHFVEVYFYATANVYSNLFSKVFLWLETRDPAQDWHASIFFANRRLEPSNLRPYRNLVASDQVSRVYLDELPQPDENQVGLRILELITAPRENAPAKARLLLNRLARMEKSVPAYRKMVELIETVVLAHFPKLSRKELEHMVQTLDLRETKVYQEAKAEGRAEGNEETRAEIAVRLLTGKFSVEKVMELTGLSIRKVQKLRKKTVNPA
mgnify:CR=1 FL=1